MQSLDFFAGSGTTGHAGFNLNKLDGGNRSFIMCTNNENKITKKYAIKEQKHNQWLQLKGIIKQELFTKDIEYKDFENNDKLLKEINHVIDKNQKNTIKLIR